MALEVEMEQQVPDALKEALEPLLDHLPIMQAEEDGIKAQLAAKQGERKRVEQTLRAAGLLEPPPKKEKPQPSMAAPSPRGVTAAKMDLIKVGLSEISGPFCEADLAHKVPQVAKSTVHRAMPQLREEGLLRLLGMRTLDRHPYKTLPHYERLEA